jgi:predicted metalloprotease with PDZ domain
MKSLLLLFSLWIVCSLAQAQTLKYQLSMPEPHTHYFEVDMIIDDWKGKSLEVKMPVWAPGSYLVREFARNVDFFEAHSTDQPLEWKKTDKNTWTVYTGGMKSIHIHYKVYAYELSVRTSFLDDSHAAINGTSIFMYIAGKKNLSGELQIAPWKGFSKISTGLESVSGKQNTFAFPDYDVLVDCPIEIGNQDIFSFDAAGVTHEVAMYGEGNYNKEMLKKDMAKVVEKATQVFGENPNKRYVFIIHNLTNPSGGLEHLNSTVLQVNRWTYTGSAYDGFLSLVAHEYFHLWNVKRMRADVLGPFDYDHENYTTLLWVQEGFTSYYDEMLLKRTGVHDRKAYLSIFSGMISSVENTPGNKVQSAAESSFDAWIKGYRTNENSVNSQISYYTKGQLLGALLDLRIIIDTKGEKSLDDLMKFMYDEYYKKLKRGFTEKEFYAAACKIAGTDLGEFFGKYVYGTESINYEPFLSPLGLKLNATSKSKDPWFGARFSEAGGKLVIKELVDGSSTYEGGLNVNDEIIACNGFRVDQSALVKMIGQAGVGGVLNILVSRDNLIKEYKIKLLPNIQNEYQVTVINQTDVNQEKLLTRWLGE